MPTGTNYKPRHRRKESFGGSTPAGPERWARAAANALKNPRSAGALLYQDRVANARYFADMYDQYTRPIGFWDRTNYVGEPRPKRKHVACGIFCAVMHAQLVWGTTDRGKIDQLLEDGVFMQTHEYGGRTWLSHEYTRMAPLDLTTLTRSVSCRVCGSLVRKPTKR